MRHPCFEYNDRLGIHTPLLETPIEEYSMDEQLRIITDWEVIRGAIPSRVMELEQNIDLKLRMMSEEEDFDITCSLNGEIAELASVINDLHIWYRITAEVSSGHRHL